MSSSTTESLFQYVMRGTILPTGAAFILLAIVVTAFTLILRANNPKERSQTLSYLLYIAIGAAILGLSLSIYGLIKAMGSDLITPSLPQGGGIDVSGNAASDESDWITGLLAGLIDLINKGLLNIVNWAVTGRWDSNTNFSLETVLFSATSDVSTELGNYSYWFLTIPMTSSKYFMFAIAIVVMPLILVAILRVAFLYISTPFNPLAKKEAGESIYRWFLSIFLIVLAPYFITAMIELNNGFISSLRQYLYSSGSSNGILSSFDINTGVKIVTSIVKLFFTFLLLRMILQFTVRKIMIIVFYIFTPIAAYMWAIKKDVAAAGIWFGELLSNIFMQFFYCLVYSIFVMVSGSRNMNWLEALIWMFMIITVSEALRNSMQGLVQRLSGVDENAVTTGFLSKMVGLSGAAVAAKTTFGSSKSVTVGKSEGKAATQSTDTTNTSGSLSPTANTAQRNTKPIFASDGSILKNVTIDSGINVNSDGYADDQPTRNVNHTWHSNHAKTNSKQEADPHSIDNVPRMMNAQSKLARRMNFVNSASNFATKLVSVPLALAAAPLGMDMQRVAGGVAKVIGGSVRAIGTPIAIGSVVKDNMKGHGREEGVENPLLNSIKNLTNTGGKYNTFGSVYKLGSLLTSNTKGDNEATTEMFNYMDPTSNKHLVRWFYSPTTYDVDNFRYTDKMVNPADVRSVGKIQA